jgi:hypothetical protein
VTVSDQLPSGLTATSMGGTGWTNCTLSPLSCSRSDSLAVNVNYPITLTVSVANNATGSLTNTASVSGGGETNTSNDTVTIAAAVAVPWQPWRALRLAAS